MYPRTPAFLRAEADYLRPPTERAPRCPCCREAYDPDEGEELTGDDAAHVGLPAGEIVCPDCAADARADVAEQVLLDAIQSAARDAWTLWGRTAPEPTLDHRVTVEALECGMGRTVDGFVAFGGAL